MSRKLHRILDEIRKTEEKIAAWQEHLGALNARREMLEDEEIIKSIRSMRLQGRELLSVLEGVQNGTVTLSGKPGADGGGGMGPELTAVEGAETMAEGPSAGDGLPGGMEPEREGFEDGREH